MYTYTYVDVYVYYIRIYYVYLFLGIPIRIRIGIFVHVNVHLHIQKTNISVYLFIYSRTFVWCTDLFMFILIPYTCQKMRNKNDNAYTSAYLCTCPIEDAQTFMGTHPHEISTYMHTKHTMSQNKYMDRDRHGTRIVSCQFLSLPRVVCDRMSSPSIGSPGAAKRQSAP
jgi:hypothetical protein